MQRPDLDRGNRDLVRVNAATAGDFALERKRYVYKTFVLGGAHRNADRRSVPARNFAGVRAVDQAVWRPSVEMGGTMRRGPWLNAGPRDASVGLRNAGGSGHARRQKKGIILRRAALGAIAALTLGLAPTASADVFPGPWDSNHQLPTITSPDVTIKFSDVTALTPYLELDIADELTCPNGTPNLTFTITFADPSGQVVNSLTTGPSMALPPEWACPWTYNGTNWQTSNAYRVAQSWSANGGAPDFSSVIMPGGSDDIATAPPTVALFDLTKSGPMLYQVSDAGGVIAEGTYTSTVTPPGTRELWDTDYANFVKYCIEANRTIYHADNGHEYCLVAAGSPTATFVAGWPAPPAAPAPAPVPINPPSVVAPPAAPGPRAVRCVVPNLRAKTLGRAKTALSRAHCAMGQVRRPGKVSPRHTLRVRAQSARPRTAHPSGFRVSVTLK
jgi:hypothetical protein